MSEDAAKVLQAAELMSEVASLLHEASGKGVFLNDTIYDLYHKAFNMHFDLVHEAKVMWNHDRNQ